ncbi:uncharacterized protein LOC131693879 [Topomyia yanbarensis]|uniref:uncharacterized protein LOC131693879 n=1 Tax=Topomyia yanbarensis TaxID=2498891 RepID=UPI00273C3111|nr:uncharacterized protein LOC131693879 [Topomyia yanbarensis]
MVWDAAAKAFGVSLNSVLLKGPDQLCSLLTILLQFRERRVALTGDIREMFHQVRIREEDQQCQRFLWDDENGEIATYVMQVMTFGACCSPSSAQFIKNLNANRFSNQFPAAVESITKRHYVDDLLVSVDTEQEAIQLAKDIKYVHSEGGFEIRNWMSNSEVVLSRLQDSSLEEKSLDLQSEMGTEKVLGMWWCMASDVFTYKVGWTRFDQALLEGQRRPTKREILRVLMTIFDPLGLIAHFLVYLKILLQEVWRSGVQWDEKIGDELFRKWQRWLRVLPQVEMVRIPRCYNLHSSPANSCDTQLHTFVDASENGIAAVCYLRFVRDDVTQCSIVAAKTRVAPLKFVSIPKLELQAAVVGARLARAVGEALSISINNRVFWTDSRDVLCWINSDHRRYTQFVAFRVGELLETTEATEWRWVPTKLNVADDGTKWERGPDLTRNSRWFTGLDFLWQPVSEWPQPTIAHGSTKTELRPHLLFHRAVPDPLCCVTNFSNWRRLINVIAAVFRFPANCRLKRRKQPIQTGPFSMEELSVAENYLISLAQLAAYPDEMTVLSQSKLQECPAKRLIHKSSPLYKLTPWIDDCGILRMRTRIAACQFATEDARSPIILPRDHHVTKLIVSHYHGKYHHLNHETVINELRQKYHISRIRVIYAKVRTNCQRCKNESSVPNPPIMADLPDARLAAFSLPFTHIGVDYFGPMEVVLGRRVEKRWGMLVICLTTRAIHIEVVNSLSTDSCILALRNVIARRGTPRRIHSDRGTNFVGASRELREAADLIDQNAIMKEFVSPETEWVFNPPSAPHMGGSWERLIRTVKKNLMATLPSRKPSDEILRSLLTEIESTVNSRPLTHVPIDDDSAPALTPNHFLLGSSSGVKPLITMDDSGSALRQNWRVSQVVANQFWKRWVTDYLPEITRKTKWFEHTKPISLGDVVVIADSNLPRNCWPKGKVIHTRVGRDGQIRSATVQTARGVYERPATKLAVLDVRRDEV